MKLEDVDKNFAQKDYQLEEGMVEYPATYEKFSMYGFYYDSKQKMYVRMDKDYMQNISKGAHFWSTSISGGRIRFSTDSGKIGIRVRVKEYPSPVSMSYSASTGFYLLEEKEDYRNQITSFSPSVKNVQNNELEFCRVHDLLGEEVNKQKRMRDYIFYCPTYVNCITDISIILEKGSKIEKGRKYKDIKPILYYGSSITQGASANSPQNAYPAYIEKWTNVDFINYGLAGNCKAEPAMCDYLSKIDCSVFVYDYDNNAPTAEYLKDTHYAFYKKYREIHPTTPIIFATRPGYFPLLESQIERRKIIKNNYKKALKEGDKNVYFIDGSKICKLAEFENCMADKSHPSDLGHYYMAKAFYKVIKNLV